MLLQRHPEDQQLHPVYYMSKKTAPAGQKYHSYELEFLAVIRALDKFKKYLLGLRFKIVTDCAAFEQTINKKELPFRVGRWVMFIEEFDYVIEHQAGTRMRYVDALSRATSINLIEGGLTTRIARAQERDGKIAAIKALFGNGPYKDYVLRHGLVYKGEEGVQRLVVPKGLQQELIRRAHEVGHFGVKKTMELLAREYWIDRMEERIGECIQNCLHCILGARKNGKDEGLLNSIPKDDTPL